MNRIAPILFAIACTTSAGSLVARSSRLEDTQLIAPEEKVWFERQPATLRRRIIADLQSAKVCISTFGKRDGEKDARSAAVKVRPKFLTAVSNGYEVYHTLPGFSACRPPFANYGENDPFEELSEAWSGPPRTMRMQRLCEAAASRYAAAFNRTLAEIKPELFKAACPKWQRDAE